MKLNVRRRPSGRKRSRLFTSLAICAFLTVTGLIPANGSEDQFKNIESEKQNREYRNDPVKERLFDPLIADPRWPHFSISYQYYIDDEELKNVGSTSFGETLPFYRGETSSGGIWQIGIQAAVFAVFDLDAKSKDLINADYTVGIPLSYRKGGISAVTKIYHQSSHLGDEFLLRERVDRINLSYEAIDVKVSYDLRDGVRIYSGAGHIIRKEPEDLKPWSVQYGIELKDPRSYFGALGAVAGADFKNREESGWDTDYTLSLGLEIESERTEWNRLHLMLEYFNGHSPNGQFYERNIKYLSLGTHFHFR